MKGEAYLVTIAAMGLSLGGFTGLINAFRGNNQKWRQQEIAGMKLILQHSFAAAGFALLPFPLFYSFNIEPAVWKWSSAGLAVFLMFAFAFNAWLMTRIPPRRKWVFVIHFLGGTTVFLILQLLNFLFWHSVTAYSWGLLWLLNPPAVQFYHFISFTESSQEREMDSK